MKVKFIKFSNPGNNRRNQDKNAEVEWDIKIEKNNKLIVKTETGQVYIWDKRIKNINIIII